MGRVTTLREIVATLDVLDDELTIYARKPWSPDCEAVVAREPDEGGLPQEAEEKSMAYFLEVFLAQEFLSSWVAAQPEPPSIDQQCDRLAQYAQYDA